MRAAITNPADEMPTKTHSVRIIQYKRGAKNAEHTLLDSFYHLRGAACILQSVYIIQYGEDEKRSGKSFFPHN